jgi:MFS family permease
MLDGGVHESAPPATRRQRIPVLLAALSAIGFCVFLSEGAIADWAGVYLHQVLRSSDAFGAAGYAVFSSAMAVFRFCGDTITRRIGRVRVIRYGGIIAAAGLAAAVVAPSPWWAIVGFGCAGAGFSSIVPNVFAAAGRVSSVREGTAVATVSGLGYLGFLVGPPAIGFTSELLSLRGGLCLLVILSAAAAMLASVVQRGGSVTACDARQEGALCRSAAPPHTLSNA